MDTLVYHCSTVYASLDFLHLVRQLLDCYDVEIKVAGVYGNRHEPYPLDEQMCIHLKIGGDVEDVESCCKGALLLGTVKVSSSFSLFCPKGHHLGDPDEEFSAKITEWINKD